MAKTDLTAERLREILHYDPETGVFTRVKTGPGARKGDVAGSTAANGYVRICVYGIRHMAHRLAWLYVYGEMPTGEIDHIDGDRANNRILNLRLATRGENCQNMKTPTTNTSGLVGACFNKSAGKWFAQIRSNGEHNYLGLFDTKEAAHEAYVTAKSVLHVFQPTIRR